MEVLKLTGVTKTYRDFALDKLSFQLPPGCIVGLVGENGAGKTTTIKIILDLIKAESGSVEIFGQSSGAVSNDVKEYMGVVLDEANFPSGLTAKNINTMLKKVYKNWDEAAFYGYLQRFSLPLDKRFKNFSRGMKMKMSIAVALSHRAKLLVLDEPTSGLDPIARDEIVDIIYDFTREENNSVLISSHIVSDLEKLCDYIAFIHQGKLLFCEEKDMLREKYAIWKGGLEEFADIDGKAVVGFRQNPYGAEALVIRDKMRSDYYLERPGIEDIIVFMSKGEEKQ